MDRFDKYGEIIRDGIDDVEQAHQIDHRQINDQPPVFINNQNEVTSLFERLKKFIIFLTVTLFFLFIGKYASNRQMTHQLENSKISELNSYQSTNEYPQTKQWNNSSGQEQTSLEESENNSDAGDQMTTTITENIQQEPLPKPQISLSSYELDFGEVKVRRYGNRIYGYDNRILIISNIGEGDLEINEVIPPSLPFEIVRNNCLRTIEPNGRCDIVVRFSPYIKYQGALSEYSYKDTFKDQVEIHTNDKVSKVALLGKSEYEQIYKRYYRFPSRYEDRRIYYTRIRHY